MTAGSPELGTSDHLTDVFFADLDLPHAVRAGIAASGFVRLTPIQAATLPLLLKGRDVAAQAQTGTGKTAAYLISAFTRLAKGGGPRGKPSPSVLVVAPTRELAVQIQDDARALGQIVKARIVTVYGGIDYAKQREQLRQGCDILIGTPGRLLDYSEQGATSFHAVETLVIDEADRLFDLGFIRDLRRIFRRCPPPAKRHSMLFSATLSYRVMELAYEHMNDAERVEVSPEKVTADRVTQSIFHVGSGEKISLLLGILAREGVPRGDRNGQPAGPPQARGMLFVNTKRFAERLVNSLERHGYHVGALTGDLPQARRLKILQDFRGGRLPLLVATDVASRGLHIEGVTHVFNIDLPQDPEDYVHRIGRTARAGQAGKAISLVCEEYVYSLSSIEKLIGAKIPVEFADDALYVRAPAPAGPPVRSGGSRHLAPVEAGPWMGKPAAVQEDEEEEEPPAPVAVAVPGVELPQELAGDFWTREAFGLEMPAVATSASVPSDGAKKRRRRRGTETPDRLAGVIRAPAVRAFLSLL